MLELQIPGLDTADMGILTVKFRTFNEREVAALGYSQLQTFNREGDLQKLDDAITNLRRAVELTIEIDVSACAYHLTNLGIAQQARFQRLGELQDLEDSLVTVLQAVEMTKVGDSARPQRLSNVGRAHSLLFGRLGELDDLRSASSYYREAASLISPNAPDRPSLLSNLGAGLFTQFARLGNVTDLEDAIVCLSEATSLTRDNHPSKPTMLLNLGNAQRKKYAQFKQFSDLQSAMVTLQRAVSLAPTGRPEVPIIMKARGEAYQDFYIHHQDIADLDNAIHDFEEAIGAAGERHPRLVDFLTQLGHAQRVRFHHSGNIMDLEKAIRSTGQAAELSGSQPIYLKNLAGCFSDRFDRRGDVHDLEMAVMCLNTALKSADSCSPDSPAIITDLANARRVRFERLGDQADIDNAITDLAMVIQATGDDDDEKAGRHLALGSAYLVRFVRTNKDSDIEDSIAHFEYAQGLINENEPNMPRILCNIGAARRTRFEHFGEFTDLQSSLSTLRRALELADKGDAVIPSALTNIANAYHDRFNCLNDTGDLQLAFEHMQNAVQLMSDGQPGLPDCLADLGDILHTRYEYGARDPEDVESGLRNLQQAIDAADQKYPKIPVFLSRLAMFQRARFECLGNISDLQAALFNAQQAVDLTDQRLLRGTFLSRLGHIQIVSFKHSSDIAILQNAVVNIREAVLLTGPRHPRRPSILKNLGIALRNRFELLGNFTDLEDAINLHNEALHITENGSPRRLSLLTNLASALRVRFEYLGGIEDIENAVHHYLEVVQLTRPGQPEKCGYMLNLGTAQITRYMQLGELSDLDNAIHNMREAVHLKPDNYREEQVIYMNLACGFLTRFHRTRQISDLDASILNFQYALNEQGHSDEPKLRANLATALNTHFDLFGRIEDLENAIHHVELAMALTEKGNMYRAGLLMKLGTYETSYSRCTDDLSRLENAIAVLHEAVQLAGPEGPWLPQCLQALAHARHARFKRLGDDKDYHACLLSFKEAAMLSDVNPSNAFVSAKKWADIAQQSGDYVSALEGYRVALGILPKLAWLGLDIPSRQDWLLRANAEDLGCLSATCAINLGRFEEAVELLDLGRSVLWQQSSALRGDFQKILRIAPKLASELRTVSLQLDKGNFHSDSLFLTASDIIGGRGQEEFGRKRRDLVGTWEALVKSVRQLPELGYFLRPLPFQRLRQSIAKGKAILINVSELGVDALVFDNSHAIQHVPLPDIDHLTLSDLSYDLISKRPALSTREQQTQYIRRYMTPALRTIWSTIISPIFDDIQISTTLCEAPPQLRVWWYTTGPLSFLPIHAAGLGGRVDVSRLVVSSYVTTLQSLLQMSMEWETRKFDDKLKFLAISQPETPGQCVLPSAKVEVEEIIQAVLAAGGSKEAITHLTGAEATVNSVSSALDSCTWVHFACHGLQHPSSGMKSAFALHDGLLELDAIASKRISSGQFAFLSVCQAATGLRKLPGEAMHLAAGLQFAGFPGVIATLWSICDEDAPLVAAHAYSYLLRDGVSEIKSSDAAVALNRAVLALRQDRTVTVDRWAPFVHFGI